MRLVPENLRNRTQVCMGTVTKPCEILEEHERENVNQNDIFLQIHGSSDEHFNEMD